MLEYEKQFWILELVNLSMGRSNTTMVGKASLKGTIVRELDPCVEKDNVFLCAVQSTLDPPPFNLAEPEKSDQKFALPANSNEYAYIHTNRKTQHPIVV